MKVIKNDFNHSSSLPIIFGLSHSHHLVKVVGEQLKLDSYILKKHIFADREIMVEIPVSVRNRSVFLCQSTSTPANESIMELLIAIDALKRASVGSVSLVMPYFGYGRQDRKTKGREPITAKLIADLIGYCQVERVITFDLHSPQIQGFFNIPIDHFSVLPSLLLSLLKNDLSNYVLISPDRGGYSRVQQLSGYLNAKVAVMDKIRKNPNQAKVNFFLGDVTDKNVVLIDDMIDTGGTLINCIEFLKKHKHARNIYVIAAHGIFSNQALDKFQTLYQNGYLTKMLVSDSIPIVNAQHYPFLQVYSLSQHISEILNLVVEGHSLSSYGKKQLELLREHRSEI